MPAENQNALDEILRRCDAAACGHGEIVGGRMIDAARAELRALRQERDDARRDLQDERSMAELRSREQRGRIDELERAINWAQGCDGDFPARKEGQGAYYWRAGLSSRANMRYDRDKLRYVHDLVKHYDRERAALRRAGEKT